MFSETPHCDCWVSRVTVEVRFGTRYGAHSHNCPSYAPSLDPVDRFNDESSRMFNESYERMRQQWTP